jgi:hypothetical protein
MEILRAGVQGKSLTIWSRGGHLLAMTDMNKIEAKDRSHD